MKIKVSEATKTQLNWMVAQCESKIEQGVYGTPDIRNGEIYLHYCGAVLCYCYSPTTDWSQGGPIFSEAGIGALFDAGSACRKSSWFATPDDQSVSTSYEGEQLDPAFIVYECPGMYGPTELIAKARCFVASRLGEEVEMPNDVV